MHVCQLCDKSLPGKMGFRTVDYIRKQSSGAHQKAIKKQSGAEGNQPETDANEPKIKIPTQATSFGFFGCEYCFRKAKAAQLLCKCSETETNCIKCKLHLRGTPLWTLEMAQNMVATIALSSGEINTRKRKSEEHQQVLDEEEGDGNTKKRREKAKATRTTPRSDADSLVERCFVCGKTREKGERRFWCMCEKCGGYGDKQGRKKKNAQHIDDNCLQALCPTGGNCMLEDVAERYGVDSSPLQIWENFFVSCKIDLKIAAEYAEQFTKQRISRKTLYNESSKFAEVGVNEKDAKAIKNYISDCNGNPPEFQANPHPHFNCELCRLSRCRLLGSPLGKPPLDDKVRVEFKRQLQSLIDGAHRRDWTPNLLKKPGQPGQGGDGDKEHFESAIAQHIGVAFIDWCRRRQRLASSPTESSGEENNGANANVTSFEAFFYQRNNALSIATKATTSPTVGRSVFEDRSILMEVSFINFGKDLESVFDLLETGYVGIRLDFRKALFSALDMVLLRRAAVIVDHPFYNPLQCLCGSKKTGDGVLGRLHRTSAYVSSVLGYWGRLDGQNSIAHNGDCCAKGGIENHHLFIVEVLQKQCNRELLRENNCPPSIWKWHRLFTDAGYGWGKNPCTCNVDYRGVNVTHWLVHQLVALGVIPDSALQQWWCGDEREGDHKRRGGHLMRCPFRLPPYMQSPEQRLFLQKLSTRGGVITSGGQHGHYSSSANYRGSNINVSSSSSSSSSFSPSATASSSSSKLTKITSAESTATAADDVERLCRQFCRCPHNRMLACSAWDLVGLIEQLSDRFTEVPEEQVVNDGRLFIVFCVRSSDAYNTVYLGTRDYVFLGTNTFALFDRRFFALSEESLKMLEARLLHLISKKAENDRKHQHRHTRPENVVQSLGHVILPQQPPSLLRVDKDYMVRFMQCYRRLHAIHLHSNL